MPKKSTKITEPNLSATEVGKGKPPKHTQFMKGASGNPDGRPKGAKNLSTHLKKAANEKVPVFVDGKKRRVPKVVAAVTQLANNAAKGDQRAIAKFLDWLDEMEARDAAAKPVQFPFSPADLEVMRETYERMKHCQSFERAN